VRDKKLRHAMVCERALDELQGWLDAQPVITAAVEAPPR
jgi:hypothetical protein